ncbi:hypothetical protein ACFW1A_00630 [Kitasatospora sp. NPDC058965]|uniref:hypothetical protein n=1 Tax=Kitasatospora sp. NPDC058965 TaxID=3346682 RepID=UPI0036B6AF49
MEQRDRHLDRAPAVPAEVVDPARLVLAVAMMASQPSAGFVPLAGFTVVADAALVPALSGAACRDLARWCSEVAGR